MVAALPVGRDDLRLSRLLQLYLHEWSGRIPLPIGDDALYRYPELDGWQGEDHDAVLFLDDGRAIGFALAARDAAMIWHVEEFFIVLGERRRGRGAQAFDALAARHPGRWTLTVRPENPDGFAFWARVFGSDPVAELGDDVVRQRFTADR
jgi:predicted acetyltransferase